MTSEIKNKLLKWLVAAQPSRSDGQTGPFTIRRTNDSKSTPAETVRLASANGRIGAGGEGPAGKAQRPLLLGEATFADASSSDAEAPKAATAPSSPE
jgi:hypothetical protein